MDKTFFAISNRATGGKLGPFIVALRDDDGLSWRKIAVRVWDTFELDHSANTIQRWYDDIKADETADVA